MPPTQNCTKDIKEFKNINETKRTSKKSNLVPASDNLTSNTIAKHQDKSPYGSSHSINDLISEFTIDEVNEILSNCKLSDDEENELLNGDNNFTRKLLQQQFSCKTKSLQHLNDLEKEEQVKTIENGLKLKSESGNQKESDNKMTSKNELNEKLQLTKTDLINNLNKLDEQSEDLERKSKFDHKFINEIDSKLDAECLNENAILNLKKTGNLKTKFGINSDDYEKPICKFKNELQSINQEKEDCNFYLTTIKDTESIEDRIEPLSPPPEFNDNNQINLNSKTDELKNQLKRRINLNNHLKSRWSCSSDHLNNHLITQLPPPASFSSSNSTGSSSKHYSSMLALQNRPKLPKNKFDFLNSNSKLSTAKKLPNKLKSLPEIFTSKLSNNLNGQKLSPTNKQIDDKINNTFSSTSLINQINQINELKQQQNLTNQQVNQLAVQLRPLPPLPLEHYIWFHNLEREQATSLLTEFGIEGGYLVRTSKRAGCNNPYSLSIYHNNKCFNLNIRKRVDGLFALGKEKEKEKVRLFNDKLYATNFNLIFFTRRFNPFPNLSNTIKPNLSY